MGPARSICRRACALCEPARGAIKSLSVSGRALRPVLERFTSPLQLLLDALFLTLCACGSFFTSSLGVRLDLRLSICSGLSGSLLPRFQPAQSLLRALDLFLLCSAHSLDAGDLVIEGLVRLLP